MSATPDLPRTGNSSDGTTGKSLTARFGTFELDFRRAELRRDGAKVRLQEQPFRLLSVLLEHGGEIVTRDELRARLWPSEFVDFEHGLNTAIRKLRVALDDSADNPRFVETLARRGYRFIAPVTWIGGPETAGSIVVPVRRGRRAVLAGAIAFAIVVSAFLVSRHLRSGRPPVTPRIEPLTTLGTVIEAAISPDGKYLAYVTSENGLQALWLKQVAAGTTLRLLPPVAATAGYWGLSFHPDGNSIYYSRRSPTGLTGSMVRIPTIGGQPQKVLDRVDSGPTFSPDGRHIAFYRRGPGHDESSLVIASADGGEERVVHTWHEPQYVTPVFFGSPAWSPDGEVIACAVNDQRGAAWLTLIRSADGSERGRVQGAFTFASQAAWLSNDELVLVASIVKLRRVAGTFGVQLWRVSLPAGLTEQITKDTFDYRSPTATADGSMIAAVVNAPYIETLRISMSGAPARKLGLGRRDGALGLEQAADGRVVFASPEGLFVTAGDGSDPRLLAGRSELGFAPAVAPDGRTVVYETFVNGKPRLCRTSVDGGPPVRLCDLPAVVRPSISSDGKSVYFSVLEEGQQLIEREPMEGGRPAIIARLNIPAFSDSKLISNPIVSPGGDRVAMFSADPQSPGLTVIALRDGSHQDFPSVTRGDWSTLRWLADGSGVLFSGTARDDANVWLQKLDGSAARPLTNFRDLDLFRFDCCRDGEMLLLRGKLNRDAVLLKMR